jgi:hypothetical protein
LDAVDRFVSFYNGLVFCGGKNAEVSAYVCRNSSEGILYYSNDQENINELGINKLSYQIKSGEKSQIPNSISVYFELQKNYGKILFEEIYR